MKKKFSFFLFLTLCLVRVNAFSQSKDPIDSLLDSLAESGQHHSRVMTWFGMHNDLYGYIDPRYKALNPSSSSDKVRDQGDYIAAHAQFWGTEFYFNDFSSITSALSDFRFGFNVAMYHRDRYKTRNLEQINVGAANPTQINAQTVPGTESARIERWWGGSIPECSSDSTRIS